MATSATRRNVTWTFTADHDVGQFVTGDLVAFGPVEVSAISPGSTDHGDYTDNGTMLDPPVDQRQGYDSRPPASTYVSALNVDPAVAGSNIIVNRGRLVTAISRTKAFSNDLPQIDEAEILTVVTDISGGGVFNEDMSDYFRPPYVGGVDVDPKYRASQLIPITSALDLAALTLPVGTPAWPFGESTLLGALTEAESQLTRPWIDHVNEWGGRDIHPKQAMPNYGRNLSSVLGIALTLLTGSSDTDAPTTAARQALYLRIVQIGIDFHGILEAGGDWPANGGHASGRMGMILFAGHALQDADMLSVCQGSGKYRFGELNQTFRITQADVDLPRRRGGPEFTADRIGNIWWGQRHIVHPHNDRADWMGDAYMRCCSANAWFGHAIALMALRLDHHTDHDPWLDWLAYYKSIGWALLEAASESDSFKVWDSWMRGVVATVWDGMYADARRPTVEPNIKLTHYGRDQLLRLIQGRRFFEGADLESDAFEPPQLHLALLHTQAGPAETVEQSASKEIQRPGSGGYERKPVSLTFADGALTLDVGVITGPALSEGGWPPPAGFWLVDSSEGGNAWYVGTFINQPAVPSGSSTTVDSGKLSISIS